MGYRVEVEFPWGEKACVQICTPCVLPDCVSDELPQATCEPFRPDVRNAMAGLTT